MDTGTGKNLSSFHFKPQPFATVAALAAVCALIALGVWQLDRADQKRALGALTEARKRAAPLEIHGQPVATEAAAYREVQARGHFDTGHMLLIENRKHAGRTGFHLVVPFAVDGSPLHLLVNRGWLAEPAQIPGMTGIHLVRGEVRAVFPPALELDFPMDEASLPHWPYLTLPRFTAWSRLDVYPFIVLENQREDDALVREWPSLPVDPAMHEGYAVQWFAFALIAFAIWARLSFVKRG